MNRPHVLFVICDDLTYGDLSLHGNPHLKTPRLDALGGESARIGRYCSGPLCTPARAAIMTGRHPYRTRAVETYISRSMLDPDEITLPQLLKTAGYDTGLFGKWHLGDCHPMRPCDRGFDESLWHRGGGLRQYANPGHFDGRDSYFNPLLTRNGDLVETRGFCTDIFTDAAMEWIRARPKDRPWFAYVAFNAPHTPLEIGDEWVAPFRDRGLPEIWEKMYGTVANIDWNVGRLLDLLTQTGQADHTLVVFTSDHGQCPSSLADGKPRFNCGLRGWKGSFYEGGVRVPCFVRWRGAIPAGGLEALANPIDWVPTLASACGYAQPTDRVIDGLDLLPALRRQAPPPDRAIPMQFNRCEIPRRFFNAAVLTPRWKWYRIEPTGPDELYDVPADPGEKHNRAAEHPDIAARLVDVYDRWFDDVSRTRPDNYGPPRIVLGHPSAPLTHLTLQDGRLLGTWEGWGLAFPCYWFVDVRREGDYRFDLDAGDKPAAWGRQWTLRAGDVVSVFVIPNRRHSVTLHLRAGPQTISCLSYGPVPDLYPNQPDPGCRTVGEISVTAIH